MRLLLQRTTGGRVVVEGRTVAETGRGLMVLAGFGRADGPDLPGSRTWKAMIEKVLDLRVFPDEAGKLNLSLRATAGDLLLVSQFTLFADCRRGRRPSFDAAAPPDAARSLYERLEADFRAAAPAGFGSGLFGADMRVEFANWGPVTILLDSADFS